MADEAHALTCRDLDREIAVEGRRVLAVVEIDMAEGDGARAHVERPRVACILDAESETLVQTALDRLMQGRTTIVIAHRLSTVRDCTHICVLEGGRIVQFGSHQELIAADGPYRRMWSRQLAAASLDIA